jgi:hypothetical protein
MKHSLALLAPILEEKASRDIIAMVKLVTESLVRCI